MLGVEQLIYKGASINMQSGYRYRYIRANDTGMQRSSKYTNWYQNKYLKRFPKPSRNENVWKQEEVSEYDFKIKKQINYELTHDFSMEHFIDFMMIQSNVNAKIEDETITETQAKEWFEKTLTPVFEDNVQTLLFQGYYWYMQLCDENNYKK